MAFSSAKILFAGIIAAASIALVSAAQLSRAQAASQSVSSPAKIIVDYPLAGSVFPPEITPPTFLWHDPSGAKLWVIEISFASHSASRPIRVETNCEHPQIGEIDPQAGAENTVSPLTPDQLAACSWHPDETTWTRIKQHSVNSPATITISGFPAGDLQSPFSRASLIISTSRDPVGAPIFYRDVPLMTTPHGEKGSIQPLPTSALPLIKWRLRNIAEPQSRVVMQKLYTCANCHSFSTDGKTLGLDVDGPKNDKGLYALLPVSKSMAIRNQDVIRWSALQENSAATAQPAIKRFGFMSQVSPDGKYVVTSIGPPAAGNAHQNENPSFAPGLSDRLFSMNYRDISFTQVFYPTRGILAWYDRKEAKLRPLPGADDPAYVQTSAFWSPDGKYLVFSRASARDPYPPGAEKPVYANDPNETQIQYDLYRIPFNDGRGGKAEPILGASQNGMSNNFPKVSPDGRWIVFVQNHNGLLMRPDSKLFIVPFAGGQPRQMKCNTSLMNSWHSFSPNGRWLAFASKARSPYTQLMLTHIDANGNDTPPILVDNTTAANRAVNIPEFVNLPADGLQTIDPQATEFYRLTTLAFDFMEKGQMADAIQQWRNALQMDPDDGQAHFGLAVALTGNNQEREALDEYRKACALDRHQPAWLAHLAASLAQTGDLDGAVANYRQSLSLDPSNAGVEADLGAALFELGQIPEALDHLQKAVAMAPDFPDAHSYLGVALAKMGRFDEAIAQLQAAISLVPTSVEYRFNLGSVLLLRHDYPAAIDAFQKSVELSDSKDPRCLAALADAYHQAGQSTAAVQAAQQALALAVQNHDDALQQSLRDALALYQQSPPESPSH